MGGWKGTTDTHELIEQTHKRYLAEKRGQAKHHVASAATATTSAAAATVERRVNQTTC